LIINNWQFEDDVSHVTFHRRLIWQLNSSCEREAILIMKNENENLKIPLSWGFSTKQIQYSLPQTHLDS
jgi:hypothetical protein